MNAGADDDGRDEPAEAGLPDSEGPPTPETSRSAGVERSSFTPSSPPSPIAASLPPQPVESRLPPPAWSPPELIDEYRIIRLIGRGGMGDVYLAHDESLDRRAAVKLIAGFEPDPAARHRFLVEARAAARLQHPNVVTVYRVGEVEGRPYIASEFIQGQVLDELSKPLPWKRALELGIGLARGLAAAHREGVLHRDLKPGNAILRESDGEVKLLDFGLAKIEHTGSPEPWSSPRAATLASAAAAFDLPGFGRSAVTDSGSLLGTPDYMPPEMWRGLPATRRSDVYSLGALLFELCAGRPPNKDLPVRALSQAASRSELPSVADVVPSVDARLAAVIDRCLHRDPLERFASGEEVREALEEITEPRTSLPLPTGNPYRGLLAFEAEHRGLFFGRHAEVGAVLDRLRTSSLVVVTGDSGVGKSSLCRAGVLPAIEEGALGGGRAWSVASFAPGRAPLAGLGAALAPLLGLGEDDAENEIRKSPERLGAAVRARLGPAGGLVLFVDQLEELVTRATTTPGRVCAEALASLTAGIPGVHVLGSVRSDFIAPMASLALTEDFGRALYFLRPLSRDGVRAAVVGPAEAKGVRFESKELVEALVAAATSADAGLPLLQFALAELWEARGSADVITSRALEAIGGVSGAVARHGDQVIGGMTAVERLATRRMLGQLVSPQLTRVGKHESELTGGEPAARRALDAMVKARLVSVRHGAEGSTYEVAHETLCKGWDTLARWLAEQQTGRAVRERLAAAVAEWERVEHAAYALWGPNQLAELAEVDAGDLSQLDLAFIKASREASSRSRRLRGSVLAVPIIAASIYALSRAYQVQDVDGRVDAQLEIARESIASAHADDRAASLLREDAYADFDAARSDEGEGKWARALAAAATAEASYTSAERVLEGTFRFDPQRMDVKNELADALFAHAALADWLGHKDRRAEVLQDMAAYDDGSRSRALDQPAEVTLHTDPPGATVTLRRYDEGKRFALPFGFEDGFTTTPAELELPPASYLIILGLPGGVSIRYPLLVAPGERLNLDLRLPLEGQVPAGFVYVPPGRFLFGYTGDETLRKFFNATPLHEKKTGGFLIAIHETTFDEWIEYLSQLPDSERAERMPHGRGWAGDVDLQELAGHDWVLRLRLDSVTLFTRYGEKVRYASRTSHAEQDWRKFPVVGVHAEDAAAYARWLSDSGRVPRAHLCTDEEWERAARGADDRMYPVGDTIYQGDVNVRDNYGWGSLGLDEVGSHTDGAKNPFDLADMSGNAGEIIAASPARYFYRGGNYFFGKVSSAVPNREEVLRSAASADIGIRMCAGFDP